MDEDIIEERKQQFVTEFKLVEKLNLCQQFWTTIKTS